MPKWVVRFTGEGFGPGLQRAFARGPFDSLDEALNWVFAEDEQRRNILGGTFEPLFSLEEDAEATRYGVLSPEAFRAMTEQSIRSEYGAEPDPDAVDELMHRAGYHKLDPQP
jgi:hypothetical protein